MDLHSILLLSGNIGWFVLIAMVLLFVSQLYMSSDLNKKRGVHEVESALYAFTRRALRGNAIREVEAESVLDYHVLLAGRPSLARIHHTDLPKTVAIVGTGAIENAWDALLKVCNTQDRTFVNQLLARAVANSREENLIGPLPEAGKSKDAAQRLFLTRNHIGSILCLPQVRAKMSVRSLSRLPAMQAAMNEKSTAIITTNWDITLGSHYAESNFLHLHGMATRPLTLLLPTELACETHRIHEENSRKAFDALMMAELCAIYWLRSAERLIVWGLALNEYDVELGVILKVQAAKEIIVIDVDRKPANLLSYINGRAVTLMNPETGDVETVENFDQAHVIQTGDHVSPFSDIKNFRPSSKS